MIFIYLPAPLNIHSFVWYWLPVTAKGFLFLLYKIVCEYQFMVYYKEPDERNEGEKGEKNPS